MRDGLRQPWRFRFFTTKCELRLMSFHVDTTPILPFVRYQQPNRPVSTDNTLSMMYMWMIGTGAGGVSKL
jgi:hypothetical protein